MCLSRIGIADGALVDLYRRNGGTILGLELLRRAAERCDLSVPPDTAFSLEEVRHLSPESFRLWLSGELRDGFALKYSGHSESFSKECVRGRNSSRRRFWNGVDEAKATRIIEDAIDEAPRDVRALVFQQYLNDPNLSGVFYAYAYEGRTLVEANSMGERTFTEVYAGRVVQQVSVSGEHIRSVSRKQADPLQVDICLQALRAEVGFDLDLEAFTSGATVVAVQMRPIPEDMPRLSESSSIPIGRGWHRTPLVWGAWENASAIVDADAPGHPAVMVKRTASLAECPTIMRRLERGDPTLVLDVVDGFRLSHDPRYLPEMVHQRQHFAYISLAGTPFADIRRGDGVQAFVDGDTGFIRRVNRTQYRAEGD